MHRRVAVPLLAGGAAGVHDGGGVPGGADATAGDLRGAVERDVLRGGEHNLPGVRVRAQHSELFVAVAKARRRAEGVQEETKAQAGGVRSAGEKAVWGQ